jgi:hypothetical protein
MDSHVADDKLKELRVEDTTVKANRDALQYEIDPAAEKKLLRKIDLHVCSPRKLRVELHGFMAADPSFSGSRSSTGPISVIPSYARTSSSKSDSLTL